MKLLRLALLLVTASVLATPSLAAAPATLEARLDSLLAGFRSDYRFPGATAAVALANGETVAVATGFSDVEAGAPMTTGSRMLAASIGKTFVAATVLALDADGRLDCEQRVSNYLGDRDWFSRVPNHASMTVAQLLRHTSGLPDHVHTQQFGRELAARVADGRDAPSPEDAIGFVLDGDPLFAAGTAWSYTDTGYLLLGLIIEQVTGRSYGEEITERFLLPLGLSTTSPSNKRVLPGLAVGYTDADNPFGIPPRNMDGEGRLYWDPAVEWTGGGLVSTARDLAVWGRALFGGRAMKEPYLDRMLDGVAVAAGAEQRRYGAGVAIWTDTPRGVVYGHGGWIPGYVASLRHYADHGITVAFQVNTDKGMADSSTNFVPALEAALADLVLEFLHEARDPSVTEQPFANR